METDSYEQPKRTCPNCGTPVIAGSVALGWGARPLFRAGERHDPKIEVPLAAGLCPTCQLVSFWAQPSEALRAMLRLHTPAQGTAGAES